MPVTHVHCTPNFGRAVAATVMAVTHDFRESPRWVALEGDHSWSPGLPAGDPGAVAPVGGCRTGLCHDAGEAGLVRSRKCRLPHPPLACFAGLATAAFFS